MKEFGPTDRRLSLASPWIRQKSLILSVTLVFQLHRTIHLLLSDSRWLLVDPSARDEDPLVKISFIESLAK